MNGLAFSTGLPGWLSGEGPDADVVISTRVRLARNFAGRRFPSKASLLERKQAFDEVASAFRGAPQFGDFECVNCSGLSRIERQFLAEQRVISPDLLVAEGDCGVAADVARRICVMINEEDHLRLQCLDSGCRPAELWNALDGIDDTLGAHLDFAFDRRRGFLTCRPADSGTGMRVSFLLHLPALILTKNIDQVLLAASQMGMATRGFFGERSNVVGGFFQLSNVATLGASENELLESARRVVEKTVECERTARRRILNDARRELLDKVRRAFGILTYATLLDVDEFLNLSSAIRLGIDCNLFNPTTIAQLNRLTLMIMPAHLQTFHKRTMDENELKSLRAETVKSFFTGA
jgi:protein arginine kinase